MPTDSTPNEEAAMSECPLDVAAIVKLAARGKAWLDAVDDPCYSLEPPARENVELCIGDLAVVVAARLAAHVGAVGLLRDVRHWANLALVPGDPMSIPYMLSEALAMAVGEGLPPERIEPLLGSDDWVVCRIIEALDGERETDLALLVRLADDPRTKVAAAASHCLTPYRRWRWYSGIFEHDPISAHADDPAVVDALSRARAALGREQADGQPVSMQALGSAVEDLPPELAVPLLEAGLLAFPSPGSKTTASETDPGSGPVVRLHALGGVQAVLRALHRLARAHGEPRWALPQAAPWCTALPAEARAELALHMLPWIDGEPDASSETTEGRSKPSTPSDDTEAHRKQLYERIGAAQLVVALWPPTRVPLPLVEWLVVRSRYSACASIVKTAIEQTTAGLEPHAERLLELALAHPRLAGELPTLFERLASAVPRPRLAAVVEAALSSGHQALHTWALELRTGPLSPSDPAKRHALAEAWLEDPRTRKAIFGSEACRARLLPWLRGRLRADALTLPEANQTLSTIGRLYGGVIEPMSLDRRPHDTELVAAERRAAARTALGPWLDEPRGPPTSQEWARRRVLAHEALDSGTRPSWDALAVLPVGPWTEQDLALLDAVEAKILPFNPMSPVMLHHFEEVLLHAPPPDAAARARRVLAGWPDDDGVSTDLGGLRRLAEGRDHAADPRPSTVATDWMDEDEEVDP